MRERSGDSLNWCQFAKSNIYIYILFFSISSRFVFVSLFVFLSPLFLSKAEMGVRGLHCWKRMNFEQKERSLIIPTCAQLHGRVEMKPLAVSPLAPPSVCMHLCLIFLSGTISPAS